jgi:outer membrane murein-binding lipoprotein Lpp
MADDIIQFAPGGKVTAEETNENNLLLKEWALDNSQSEAYIDGKIATLTSNLNSQISSLNSQISSLNTQINTVNNQTKSAYKKNNATITLNTWVDLKSWLPADGYYWLVSIDQECNHNGGTPPIFTAYSDVQSAVKVCKPDDDSGRSSCAAGNAKILVGSQRRLRVDSTNKDWSYTLTRIRGAVRLGRI